MIRPKKKPTKQETLDSADGYEESITLQRLNVRKKQRLANSNTYRRSAVFSGRNDDKKPRLVEQVVKKRKRIELFSTHSITA